MFRPADTITALFSFLLLVLTAFFYSKIPSAPYLILIYASLIFFQLMLVYLSRLNSFLALTRDIIFPVISVLIIFDSLELIVHTVNPQDLDYLLIRLDYLIFGVYPTIVMESIIQPLLSDMLQIAYTTYYFLPIMLGIALKVKKKNEDFEKSLFLILLCFYLSYVGYLLVPALGPRYAMEHLHGVELTGFLVFKPINETLNLLEGIKRNAFPSGHTAITLTVLFLSYRYARGLFWATLTPALLLIVATVYCRYHYVIDVIAGAFLTVVTIGLGEVYYKAYKNSSSKKRDFKRET